MNKKDIGLKVATKKEALWMKVRDTTKQRISQLEDDIEINKEILKRAEQIISEEQK